MTDRCPQCHERAGIADGGCIKCGHEMPATNTFNKEPTMTDFPVNLNNIRARASQDARARTVADMLEVTLADCEKEGWSKGVILLFREHGEVFSVDLRAAGCTKIEARGMVLTYIIDEANER